jgi:hypothetical protein
MFLGNTRQASFEAVFLLISLSLSAQEEKHYKFLYNSDIQEYNILSDNNSVIINYSVSEADVENINNNDDQYFRLSIPGHFPTSDPGQPELPVMSRMLSFPEGYEYKIVISNVKSSVIKPSAKKIKGILYPAQVSENKSFQEQKHEFKIDKKVYSEDGTIKADTVKIEYQGTIRNRKIYNLIISPARYTPHLNIIELITSMKIEILFNKNVSQSKSAQYESLPFIKSIDTNITEFNPLDIIPGYSESPVKMIILTDTSFRKQLAPLIKWKTQKGLSIQTLYRGNKLAGYSYTELRDTIKKIYKSTPPDEVPPEYLLIVGNVSKIPYYGNSNVTDNYYGEFDGGDDYLPEMFIGRLPVSDTNQLKSVINKIIQYEKFQFLPDNRFYTKAFVTAGNAPSFANQMNGQVKYAIDNYLNINNGITEKHFYYPQSTAFTVIDSIKKIINSGVSFINYSGHANANGWLFYQDESKYYLSAAEISELSNKYMYPFIISNACKTADFSILPATGYPYSSFGNEMVTNNEKGAIGFIGCSSNSFWNEDYYWAVGAGTPSANPSYTNTGLGAYDRLFHTHKESPSEWYYTMGQINYAGNLAVSSSTSQWKKYYWETYNLIGDPSLTPYIGSPEFQNISLPDTIPNGIKLWSLDTKPFSYVAISHFDTLWDASFSSPSGSVTLNLPGLSDDSCMIVISGQNKIPVIKTIYISNIKNEFINLDSTVFKDQFGNNNGIADYGETLYMNMTISNLGQTDADNLIVYVSSPSSYVKLNDNHFLINKIKAGSSITLNNDISFNISDSIPDLNNVIFNLTLKNFRIENKYSIDLLTHAPKLKIENCAIDDTEFGNGDHIADPGELFYLVYNVSNMGSSDISGQFSVSSSDSDLSIIEPNIKSGMLKFGKLTQIPVLFKLSDTIPSGSYLSVSSTLNCNPYIVNREFSFRVGKVRESFESASFSVFPWIGSGNFPWTISTTTPYDGGYSAKSGAITDNNSSSLMIRGFYSSSDSLRFSYKVSSEKGYDYLLFRINGKDIFRASGEVPWTRKSLFVNKGLNTMEWIYRKDATLHEGSDCAWIDLIDFVTTGSVVYIKNDLEVTRIVTPEEKEYYDMEPVSVSVRNAGNDTIKSINMAYQLNNQIPVQQLFENLSLRYGDSTTLSFNNKVDLSKYGIYKLKVYSQNAKDDYSHNDTLSTTIEHTKDIIVYPNPFNNMLSIALNMQINDNLNISITDIHGIILYNYMKSAFKGSNIYELKNLYLKPSIYFLNIKGETINRTILILKTNK